MLLFFQAMLLLGYLYAHVSVAQLGVRRGGLVHGGLVVLALTLWVVGPAPFADLRNAALPPALDLLVILLVAVGPAVFVVAATTPLLSAWFARLGGRGAYRLYALSNAGSLGALLAYPLIVEPVTGLASQRGAWAVGFGLLGILLGACALAVRRAASPRVADASPGASTPRPDARSRLRWIILAAIPSGLLLAVTNLVTTDLIAAPLLWVGPLAIYLVSFVVAFSPRGDRLVRGAGWLAPAAVMLMFVPFGSIQGWPVLPLLALEFGCLLVVATALHGRLAAARPAEGHLTEFYLFLSLGGVAGGAFVALVAPAMFPGIWEYPILLAAAMGAVALTGPSLGGLVGRIAPFLLVALAIAGTLAAARSPALEDASTWLLVGLVALLVGGRPATLAAITAAVLVLSLVLVPGPAIFRDRGFFGVIEVSPEPAGRWMRLRNGTTIHGFQFTDPARRLEPTAYYARSGPVGDVIGELAAGPRSIGVVGLGTGTMASYLRPGDEMTFFEIDPLVVEVARRQFTFLAESAGSTSVVVDDGRLALAEVPDASLDLLVLDAFSSDAVPAHLLTTEALAEAVRVVRPDGLVALHLSNVYYDLVPAVAAGAERLGLAAQERSFRPTEAQMDEAVAPSDWLVIAREAGRLRGLTSRGWLPAIGGPVVLTDDHPNLLRYLDLGVG